MRFLEKRLVCVSTAVLLVLSRVSGAVPAVVVEDFATGTGRFNSPINAARANGFFHDTSSATHEPAVGHNALGSLKLVIDDNPDEDFRGTDPWRLVFLSGGGVPANNLSLPSTGSVGYWLKTTDADVFASIVVNDGAGTEQARNRPVVADGQWHLYEWDFDSPIQADWSNYSGGNGVVDSPSVTIHGLQLYGMGAPHGVDTIWIDDISHNPAGSLIPEPVSLSLLGLGGLLLMRRR